MDTPTKPNKAETPSSSAQNSPKPASRRRWFGLAAQIDRIIDQEEYKLYYEDSHADSINFESVLSSLEPIGKEYEQTLLDFAKNSKAPTLLLDGTTTPIPTSDVRSCLHSVAEKLNWQHETIQKGENRILSVSKRWPIAIPIDSAPPGSAYLVHEYLTCGAYVALKGPHVEAVAKHFSKGLHASILERRRKERNVEHHITIASASVLRDLPSDQDVEPFFERLRQVEDDWKPIGLGAVKSDSTGFYAVFVVLSWPSMTQKLLELGVEEQHFHITLGFQDVDIHHVPKDETALVTPDRMPHIMALEAVPQSSPSKDTPKNRKPGASKNGKTEEAPSTSETPPKKKDRRTPQKNTDNKSDNTDIGSARAPTAFILYAAEMRVTIKQEQPTLSLTDLLKVIGDRWSKATDEEKKPWIQKAEAEKKKLESQRGTQGSTPTITPMSQ